MRLVAEYPCCHGAAILDEVAAAPVQKWDRTCRRCGTTWVVSRSARPVTKLTQDGATAVTTRVLTWERAA